MKNNDIGFVSAKEIIKETLGSYNIIVQQEDIPNLSKLFLSKDVFDYRCEQYKKYVGDEISFCNHYSDFYKLFMKQGVYHYEFWLFDFVMNGGLDNEKVKV